MYSSQLDNTVYSSSTNLVDVIIDEIALEGLDGITLEALWKRLGARLQIQDNFPRALKEQAWNICISTKSIIFYELDSPREPLYLYDRYEYVDPDLGIISEPDNVPDDIYEYYPIDDTKNGIKGSCKGYHTRKLIENIRCLNLNIAENRYGQTLVMVGSQLIREQALMGDTVCPTIELSIVQYCFLERVGRARYHGEVTQGKRSLAILKEDPKSLFYYRKFLLKHRLITKQLHYQKNSGHGTGGSLLHLPRFYVERKPKIVYLAEQIIALLKTRENYLADYKEIKKALHIENSIKRLFKTACFQKVVRTDLLVPYRVLYPQADQSEWARKNCTSKEKKIRAVQLIDPNIDASDLWNKDDAIDDEESYELDVTNQMIDVPTLKQANWIVEATRDEGLSQLELAKKMGVTKLQARTTLKNLSKLGLIGTYMNDIGRQRITKYVSKKFEKNSKISKQYHKEIHKMKELTRNINVSEYSFQSQFSVAKDFFYPHDNDVELLEVDTPAVVDDDPFKNIGEQQIRGQALFGVVNKIFKKYKLNKYKRKYDTCFNNVSQMKDLKKKLNKVAKRIKSTPRRVIKLITPDADGIPEDMCDAILEETRPTNASEGEMKYLMREINAEDLKITGSVTYRILKRANLIIEAVKEHKVIDDTTKLIKLINEEEEREGYDVKIDKKSLVRLLQKLAVDNLVKNIKLTLSANGKQKSLTFICDPSINVNHSVIQSAVEQARVKFCLTRFYRDTAKSNVETIDKNDNNLNKPSKKMKTASDFNAERKIIPANLTFDCKAGKKYGYSPKFIRMQILHQFLYYLIYDHEGTLKIPRSKQIQNLRIRGYQIDDELEKEMGEIYNTQGSWKTFVPPLPEHSGWPSGWALMCDILLRIPLSMFLKVYRLPFFIPDLDYYINHSIRKHYLIKDLPTLLRNALLLKRKYIFSIHETITRLCYIGLIQFGPQKLKEKDQVFIYLNRKSELMDTTTSAAGYHKIQDKEYPITKYLFNKITVVEKYWYDMWHICVNTQLGGRLAVQGTEIILEELTKKPEMIQCLKPISAQEAESSDLGIMPGDKKGAAGIDSAFFSHLKRNWNWDNFNDYKPPRDSERKELDPERNAHLSKIQSKPIKYTEFSGLKKKSGPTTVDANTLKNKKNSKSVTLSSIDKTLKHKLLTNKNVRKQNTVVRKVLPRKKQIRKRVKYDDVDYTALQHMKKLRVDWDPREDNILLVCKVVMLYLCPNPRKQLITFTAVRDVLRSYSLNSVNKTSRACQRRLLYMLKQPQTAHSVALGVEEIKQNYYVNKKYKDVINKIRTTCDSNEQEEKAADIFKSLVAYVAKKYYDISQSESTKELSSKPQTIQEFKFFYEITHPQKPISSQGFTNDVKNVNDIHTSTINSVIYSSMGCGKDRRSWAYQLFRIYQQYPEALLRNAMARIRADGMVSIAKHYLNALKKYGNCLPISSSQYQLSTSYLYKFQTKLPFETYGEIQNFLLKIIEGYKQNPNDINRGIKFQPPTGGIVVGVQEFLFNNKLDFNIEIPDHVITLDPGIREYDETYIRIAKRYQDILLALELFNSERRDVERDGNNHQLNAGENLQENNSEENRRNITDEARVKPDPIGGGQKVIRKGQPKKYQWGFYQIKGQTDEQDNEDWYFNNSDAEDDVESIRFQDGNIINISNHDIMRSKNIPVDESIHEAFLKTHGDNFQDFLESSSVIDLENMNEDYSAMEVDQEICQQDDQQNDRQYYDNEKNTECNNQNNDNNYNEENTCIEYVELKPIFLENTKVTNIVNNVIGNKEQQPGPSSIVQNQDSGDAQRRYTRIALLKMREELSEDLPDSHHAHEYFAVNSFDISYILPEIEEERINNCEQEIDDELYNNILMFNKDNFIEVIDDLHKYAIFPKKFEDYASVKENLETITELKEEEIDLIYDYVRNKHEQGATLKELITKFYKILGDKMYDILAFMTEQRLFLRSGVSEMHYIHYNYVDPWLISSIRIMRLQREALPPIPPGSVYMFNSNNSNNKKNNKNDNNRNELNNKQAEELNSSSSKNNDNLDNNDKSNSTIDNNQNGNEIKNQQQADNNEKNHKESDSINSNNQKNLRKNRTCLLQTKDIYTAAKRLDLNTAEDIRVVIRPWIQIDGVINKGMLEKMMGAVLAHCIMNPGVYLSQIQSRFIPALQPYHTRELVELLVKLECLIIKVLRKNTTTLFSKSSSTKICYPVKVDGSSEYGKGIIVEATVGASIKFGTFFRFYHAQRTISDN